VTLERLRASLADRYRIERELGSGGMATVYLAEDLKHDRKVALKVLRPELAAVLGAERFLSEIKTTANLQHPHILPLFDSGEADGFLFYVMPYVEGETVRDRLHREKQLPVDDALRIATEVASALDYAHRRGIVHRDIKPENILLHDGSALVADFGIALAASMAGGSRMTETGMSLGTPHYMSPEQAMGEREITARSDVYALGCVLYEMLLGEPPFTGPTAQAIVAKVMSEKPAGLVARRARIPPEVEEAVLTALEKLAADRFGSAAEFAAALQRRGGGTPRRHDGAAASHRLRLWGLVPLAGLVLAMGFLWGRRSGGGTGELPREWKAEALGGAQVAMRPVPSRNGQMVAFQAMVDGQVQIAVITPTSGAWRVLTEDRSRGLINDHSWARDDSKIYFDRFADVPNGIFSVSPLGTDERLVLADAAYPDVLPDGSLLITRINAERNGEIYHFWPESGRLDTLGAVTIGVNLPQYYRSFPDGREAAFYGRAESRKEDGTRLYAIDLVGKQVRPLAPDSNFGAVSGVAVTPDGRWVVLTTTSGPLTRVIAVARDGSGRTEYLASLLTSTSVGVEVGGDGSLYFDQYVRPRQLLRFDPVRRRTEAQMVPPPGNGITSLLPLGDGRILLTVLAGEGTRVMVLAPGRDAMPFMGTTEQSDGPLARLGNDRVVLMLGSGADQSAAIVSLATGQLIRRLPGLKTVSLAGSPDGRTLYYVDGRVVWAMPSDGGQPRKIRDGDAVATDPNGRYLVVLVNDVDQVRLFHVPLDGTAEHEILVHGDIRFATGAFLTSNAVAADGRIIVRVAPASKWFWPAAVLDPRTGSLELLPPGEGYDGRGGWSPDGQPVYDAIGVQSTLWRFRPLHGTGG
jgi:sugar lactone lactonase YvrE